MCFEYVLGIILAFVIWFIFIATNIIESIKSEEYMEEIEEDDVDVVYVIYR